MITEANRGSRLAIHERRGGDQRADVVTVQEVGSRCDGWAEVATVATVVRTVAERAALFAAACSSLASSSAPMARSYSRRRSLGGRGGVGEALTDKAGGRLQQWDPLHPSLPLKQRTQAPWSGPQCAPHRRHAAAAAVPAPPPDR